MSAAPRTPTLSLPAQMVLIYILFAYGIPFTLVQLTGIRPIYYNDPPMNWLGLGLVACVLLVYAMVNVRGRPAGVPARAVRLVGDATQLTALAAILLISVVSYAADDNRWRYSDQGLSESGSPLLFAYSLCPTVLRVFLFVYLFYDRKFADGKGRFLFAKKTLLILGLFLSANGNATMLVALIGSIYIAFPKATRDIFLVGANRASAKRGPLVNARGLTALLAIPVLLAALLAGGWLLGESIKRGDTIGSVVDWLGDQDFRTWLFEWLVGRTSTSYFSLMVALDSFALSTDWHTPLQHLFAPISSFIFRLDQILLGIFDVMRPEDGSLMRINYLLLTPSPLNPREGTAPGLVAGFLISFPFPLNFAALAAYLALVTWFIKGMLRGVQGRLTLTGKLTFAFFAVVPLFESPLDFLLIIDDSLIYLALLLWIRSACTDRSGPAVRSRPLLAPPAAPSRSIP